VPVLPDDVQLPGGVRQIAEAERRDGGKGDTVVVVTAHPVPGRAHDRRGALQRGLVDEGEPGVEVIVQLPRGRAAEGFRCLAPHPGDLLVRRGKFLDLAAVQHDPDARVHAITAREKVSGSPRSHAFGSASTRLMNGLPERIRSLAVAAVYSTTSSCLPMRNSASESCRRTLM